MRGQPGLWDLDQCYERLSAVGDPLEKLNAIIPWAMFEKPLAKALKRSDGSKGGRPPFLKVLVLQALYNLSDDEAGFVIQDRLSFMWFLGLSLSQSVQVPSIICLPVSTSIAQSQVIWPRAARDKRLAIAPRWSCPVKTLCGHLSERK